MNESKSHIKNITKLVAEIYKQKNRLSPPTALPITEKLFSIRSNIVDLDNLYELNFFSKSLIRKVLRKQNGFKTKIKKTGKKKLPSMSGFIASLGCVTLSTVCFFNLVEIICKRLIQRM